MKLKSICGVIIGANQPEALAKFYSQAFGVEMQRADHGEGDTHFGVDIGRIHLGIQPKENVCMRSEGGSSISIAYNVESLDEVVDNLEALSAEVVIPVSEEGFGRGATYKDLEGNFFEVVEISYVFKDA